MSQQSLPVVRLGLTAQPWVYADTSKTAKIYESLANTDLQRICLKGNSAR